MIYNLKIKEKAIDSIKGKWIPLMITFFIIALISIITNSIYGLLTINLREEILLLEEKLAAIDIFDQSTEEYMALYQNLMTATVALSIYEIINVVGSIATALFSITLISINLHVAKGGDYDIKDFKSFIKRLWESLKLEALIYVKVFLWSLLFIIPGIIKAFSYSMALYIKQENPEYTCGKAIKESEKLMMGYKMNLFVFYLSFIGWAILVGIANMIIESIIPVNNSFLILGNILANIVVLPLNVYIAVAEAHYYIELKKERANYEEYINNKNSFNSFNNFNENVDSNPFSDFKDNDKKEKKDDNNPFSEF